MTRKSEGSGPQKSAPEGSERDRIIAAMMALLAEKSFEQIELTEIAHRAQIALARLRGEFSSPFAILAAHVKDVDQAVLSGADSDMAEETAREKLFDVLMRRLEVLAPHKEAIRSLLCTSARNPGLAFALNQHAVRSQQWMLNAAGIHATGGKGMIRAQGLALLFARVLCVWIDDEDPGLARTMAALDRELSRGERWTGLLDDLCLLPELFRGRQRWRARRRQKEGGEPAAA